MEGGKMTEPDHAKWRENAKEYLAVGEYAYDVSNIDYDLCSRVIALADRIDALEAEEVEVVCPQCHGMSADWHMHTGGFICGVCDGKGRIKAKRSKP
jgi:hypothetical protein